ncbi:MAG: 50S ribosomal protein L21 [Bacteroidetes bacterium]|nr:50S ribosomal protein L21 [Bacteroidota bacterium]MBK9319747.1 50S ribosomal protein L21 [Bacteroidota bacterium]
MYAIVNIAGQQFKVQENKPVYVHRIDANEGDALKFDQVLLVDNNGSVTVGAPLISGAAVTAKVISHLKGDKVLVFKKKRRKGYQKMNGHRQALTKIQIETISA